MHVVTLGSGLTGSTTATSASRLDREHRMPAVPQQLALHRLNPSTGGLPMLTKIAFMPLARVLALTPNPDVIVISVTDSSPQAVRPNLEGYHDVLRLQFVDIAEEQVGVEVGSWPIEPTPQQHENISELRGERLPALSDAAAVRHFLDKHSAATERFSVLVHCFAGASRSAAIAQWAAATYDIPLEDVAGRGTAEANKRMLRLLDLSTNR